jgi:hypothetical protein
MVYHHKSLELLRVLKEPADQSAPPVECDWQDIGEVLAHADVAAVGDINVKLAALGSALRLG